MENKNTILSQNDSELLEAVGLRYGKIVTFEQIQAVAGDSVTRGPVRQRVTQVSKAS